MISLEAVRAAMRREGIDALVLRPSPDFRFLGGRGAAFLVVTHDGPPVESRVPVVPAGARRVGVDPEMRVAELFALRIDAELVPAGAVLAPLRRTKQPHELTALARAGASAGAALAVVRDLAWFGRTEHAMALRLRIALAESGCEEVLSVNVAAGEHTALPWHRPSGRVINPGDALQVSVCGRWDGYCAEVARVFAVAEPPDDFEAMYSVVLAAHRAALHAVRPGRRVGEVAASAREVIEGSGYGPFAAPLSGRGIGLGHDEPVDDEVVLEPGMTLVLAPAIHLPDLFGARLTDVATCTATPLTPAPPTLHILER